MPVPISDIADAARAEGFEAAKRRAAQLVEEFLGHYDNYPSDSELVKEVANTIRELKDDFTK
jgi:hypothetical protein